MNPLAAPRELAYQIADADIGAVLTISPLAGRLPPDVPRVLLDDAPRTATVIVGGASRTVDLGSHYALELEGDADAPGRPEEAAIVYTSAMFGRPLGAILTHRGLLTSARGTIDVAGITADDRVLAALPYSHLFGLVATAISPLLAGARVTTVQRFRASSAIDLLEGGITMFVGVPAMFIALLSAIERRGTSFRSGTLRLCISGGAPLDAAVQDRWLETTGIELRQGYGLTEASPVALFNRFDAPNARGTLGRAFPGVEVSIRDVATFTPLAEGETGEICVRGEIVFAGYLHAPGAEPPVGLEVRDGWLRTGDLGIRRPDGTVVFRGVVKAMFTRNGFNIYPREIEAAACELPGVSSAAVSAVSDSAHENAIALTVTGSVTEQRVKEWCEERLSAYKQPSTITIVPAR